MIGYLFNPRIQFFFFPFQLQHADVRTFPVLSHFGCQYHLVILDDFTHHAWTLPMCQKSEAFSLKRAFSSYVTTQHLLHVLAFQTNNGKEFGNSSLRSLFSKAAFICAFPVHIFPLKMEKPNAFYRLLTTHHAFHSCAPLTFWVEALSTTTYLLNRWSCRDTGTTTPFELRCLAFLHHMSIYVFLAACAFQI